MPHYLMPDGEKLYVREFGQGTPVLVCKRPLNTPYEFIL